MYILITVILKKHLPDIFVWKTQICVWRHNKESFYTAVQRKQIMKKTYPLIMCNTLWYVLFIICIKCFS